MLGDRGQGGEGNLHIKTKDLPLGRTRNINDLRIAMVDIYKKVTVITTLQCNNCSTRMYAAAETKLRSNSECLDTRQAFIAEVGNTSLYRRIPQQYLRHLLI